MTLFSEEDGMLRIPATSPCRRDYQLRSPRAGQESECESELETSRPQSPWQPRGGVSIFRLESPSPATMDRPKCYSGPLPGAQQGVASSYYSGPLPSPSPLPSYFSGAALPGFMVPTTKSFVSRVGECSNGSRQLVEASSVSGRLPEVGSSRESSFRGEDGLSVGEGDDEVDEVLYTSYLCKGDERSTPRRSRMASPLPNYYSLEQSQGARMRKCVSGELGMRCEPALRRAQVARGYRSGEIVGLKSRADGIYPRSDVRSEVEALVKGGREISVRKEQLQSESVLWEAMNDAENERPNSESAMVAIPIKCEEMPGNLRDPTNKPSSRSSSISRFTQITSEQKVSPESQIRVTNERSIHRFYGDSENEAKKAEKEHWSESEAKRVAPATPKLQKSSSVSTSKPKPKPEKAVSYAVPFKWEVEPGKPKVEEKASRSPEAMPALQLPPRLASSASVRRTSWSVSAPPSRRNSISASSSNRARQPTPYLSASVVSTSSSVGKHSHRSQEERHSPPQPSPSPAPFQGAKPRCTLATALRSSPSDKTARPKDLTPKGGSIEPLSLQFGSPQYQNAEHLCEDSVSWNRVRSPTSTLCGPGSDSHSTPSCKSDKSSRKSSVSFSHSQSATSAESFEQWAYGDHISPTSRHPSIREFSESEGFSRQSSVKVREEVDQLPAADGTITKLRRKLNLKSSRSKPPMSPIRPSIAASATSSRSVDTNGYSSHGEEYFDCQPGNGSSPSPSSDPKHIQAHSDPEEAEVELQTRLPYKMPSPVHHVEPKEVSPSSPARAVPDFSNCLALPRFLSKGESPCSWVENPSWDLPNAPTNTVEDGYRSPAYKATLELLSPLPDLMSKKSSSRVSKLPRSSSSRRRHLHLVVSFDLLTLSRLIELLR